MKYLKYVRDCLAESLAAFPKGFRFIPVFLWIVGVMALFGTITSVIGQWQYAVTVAILFGLVATLFLKSAVKCSYNIIVIEK